MTLTPVLPSPSLDPEQDRACVEESFKTKPDYIDEPGHPNDGGIFCRNTGPNPYPNSDPNPSPNPSPNPYPNSDLPLTLTRRHLP